MDPTPDSILPVLSGSDTRSQIEQFLQEVVAWLEVVPPAPPRRGRPTILPSLCLWLGLVV